VNKISGEKCLGRTETSVIFEFSIPNTSDYFDGHFPGFPILPAVAQVDIIMRYVSDYFKIGVELSEIKRIKFTSLIRPDTPLVLNLEKKENIISFRMNSPDGKTVYSVGNLSAGFRGV
jgi:3-hydroxymyristoyl/3-hydroxydecanoyl-(acyl carrier protein) dehydratase